MDANQFEEAAKRFKDDTEFNAKVLESEGYLPPYKEVKRVCEEQKMLEIDAPDFVDRLVAPLAVLLRKAEKGSEDAVTLSSLIAILLHRKKNSTYSDKTEIKVEHLVVPQGASEEEIAKLLRAKNLPPTVRNALAEHIRNDVAGNADKTVLMSDGEGGEGEKSIVDQLLGTMTKKD